ncbi:MAG: orotate phosphoribosyltransferase [Gammaproteobacteria bacterium]|nr:orotate phosphoribosyltransferase [Gammaproteobacteria bacterium]
MSDIISELIDADVLRFGDFVLKSGRRAPFFFNLGNLSSGTAMRRLGNAYADCLMTYDPLPEVIFGPAYKGIALAVAAATALAERGVDIHYAHDRKEAKTHGEGGTLVGASMAGRRVVIVDDVISDGTAKIESARLIESAGGKVQGVVVALDRQELVGDRHTAVQLLRQRLAIPVLSVTNVDAVLKHLQSDPSHHDEARRIAEHMKHHRLDPS